MNLDPAAPEVKTIAQCDGCPPISPVAAGSPICGIYGIWCGANEKWYVGQSVNIARRVYEHFRFLRLGRHHSAPLQRSWDKYGPKSFLWTVLEVVGSRDKLLAAELGYTAGLSALCPSGFVLVAGGTENKLVSEETRARMSKAALGRSVSAEVRKVLSERAKDWWRAPGALEAIRRSRTWGPRSEETKIKISESLVGRSVSGATRKRMSEAQLGHAVSENTRARIAEANRTRVISEETRAKLSRASKKRWSKFQADLTIK